jgi:hypothetical protein
MLCIVNCQQVGLHMLDVIVVRQHKSNYSNPVTFRPGDQLLVGEKDSEYLGWVRITDLKGNIGWAPIEYIQQKEGSSTAVAVKSYTAKELDVEPGERLSVKYEHCQWCWVEHRTKGAGWVPTACLENA